MCPQLEGSSPEKTLPSFHLSPAQPEKKQNCFTLVCRFTLLFPLGDSMYAAVAGASWSPSPLGKKKCLQKIMSFLPLGRAGSWTEIFSSASVCRLQMKTGFFSTGRRLQSKMACRGRKLKIKEWLCENTYSFLWFKTNNNQQKKTNNNQHRKTDVVTSYRRIRIS